MPLNLPVKKELSCSERRNSLNSFAESSLLGWRARRSTQKSTARFHFTGGFRVRTPDAESPGGAAFINQSYASSTIFRKSKGESRPGMGKNAFGFSRRNSHRGSSPAPKSPMAFFSSGKTCHKHFGRLRGGTQSPASRVHAGRTRPAPGTIIRFLIFVVEARILVALQNAPSGGGSPGQSGHHSFLTPFRRRTVADHHKMD